jgi:adenine phosphoribosyltransferase
VKAYDGQKFYDIEICGLKRRLPVVKVGEGTWIASNAQLMFGCDVQFTETVGRELASRIKDYNPEYLIVPEAKAEALAFEIARNLGHKEYAIARKGKKAYMEEPIYVEGLRSITTNEPQQLVLDRINIERLKKKKVCALDDTVSTGGTFDALKKLVSRSDGIVECEFSVWSEGPSLHEGLNYLGVLPIFVKNLKK